MSLDPHDLDWQQQASCLNSDPDLFFPDNGDQATVADAKVVCASCPVRLKCLDWAVINLTGREDVGVWGGTTREQRRAIRRGRRLAAG